MKLVAPLSLACFLVLLSGAAARAQVDTGSIVGTVTDASGAVLPGATVTAIQQGTSTTLVATTNDKGQYVFPTLKIGTYIVTAELSGFKKAVQQGVELHVQQRVDVSLQLPLGQVSEEVVVSGHVELLQTQTADMGHAVDERQLTDLPLLGRRYAELAFLQTGVVQAPVGISSRGEDTFFNANGNYATWNNFMLDGADNNSFSTNLQERSAEVIQPPVDALQEFKVQTRTYSAEFGKSAGAVINASIKQGTNGFRGSAFEFFRDEALNANTWDGNRAGRPKGQFNQHIAGFTLGGPVVRSRTFFFGDFQGTRTDRALTQTATVPTPLMRAGNLVELTRPMTAGSPFVGAGCIDVAAKTVNQACIDPVAAAILKLYPMPNIPSAIARQGQPGSFGVPNYISNGILHHDVNQFDVRIDHTLRQSRDQIFGRFSYMKTTRREPPTLDDPVASGDFSSNIFNTGQSVVGGWTRVVSDRMLNEARLAWNQIDSDVLHLAFGIDAASRVGLRGVPNDPRYSGGLPHTTIAGLTRIGGPFFRPQFQTSHVWQFADHLTWNRGSHALKFGFEKRRDAVDYIDLRALNGLISFSDARYTNVGYADFLLGLAATQGLTLFHEADLFTDGWQLYGQDAWRPTSRLTIDYGLRYEYFTPMQDRENILTNIVPENGAIVTAASSGTIADRTLIQPDRNNVAPRAGFAYTFNPALAVRGGYGIFYQETDRYGSESQLALNPPQLVDVNLNANSATDSPVMILRNGFSPVSASNVDKRLVQWRIQDPNQRTPIVHQFSLGPEYQFGQHMVVSAEYVGNRIRNGRRLRNLNQGIVQGSTVVFPYAQYGFANAYLEQIVTVGRANYDSLQTKLQRRFSDGLGFTVSYTYGRALGDFIDHLTAGFGATGNLPQNAQNMAADYGRLPFDIRHRLSTSFVYELPWGDSRRFKPAGIAGAIVRDWSVNGVLSVASGRPFTIGSTDRSNTGPGHASRANCVGDALPSGFDRTLDRWFDTTAFAEPSAFTFGTCGYNTVVGPGSKSMNFSVFRSIPLPDQRRIELRIETFNLFNWVNYDFPGMSVSNQGTFGRITSSLGDPREMQLAVKLYF